MARRRPVAAPRVDRSGVAVDYEHVPPFHFRIADDLSLPHVWDIVRAFVEPAQRNGPPLGCILAGQALFTFREALIGFVLGGLLGLGLGVLFVHSRLAERALVPYVVASQTVPILAISPIIVVATAGRLAVGRGHLGLPDVLPGDDRGAARAARGRSAGVRAVPLVRGVAAPGPVAAAAPDVGAVPLLGPADRRRGGVIGAIIGELPSGIPDGLGGAILNYNQYYTQAPEKLWATIIDVLARRARRSSGSSARPSAA